MTVALAGNGRVVLCRFDEILLIDLHGLATQFALTTVDEQEHHGETLRFELVLQFRCPPLASPCSEQQFFNDVELDHSSHALQ